RGLERRRRRVGRDRLGGVERRDRARRRGELERVGDRAGGGSVVDAGDGGMSEGRALGQRPPVRVEIVGDRSAAMRSDEGFVRVRRLVLRNHYEDGTTSRDYRYDCAERDAIDAVGIVLVDRAGRVCLRSSIRPPIALRPTYALPLEGESGDPTLFEIPAGL